MKNLLAYEEMDEGLASAVAGAFKSHKPNVKLGEKYIDKEAGVVIKIVNIETPFKNSILVKMFNLETGKEVPGVSILHNEDIKMDRLEKYTGTPVLKPTVDREHRKKYSELYGSTPGAEDVTEDD